MRGLAAILLLISAVAHGRSLSWDSLDVTAKLEADGRLHVIERQAMLFDGDWNGGERRFHIGAGQGFEFVGLSEIAAAGGERQALQRGDLARVGNYDFTGAYVLRWRSRLPSDPPFRNARRVYELEYVLSGVVRKTNGGYALVHDFAFPERPGEIAHFSARLSLDPAWQLADGSSTEIHGDHLAPGQSAIMRLQFNYLGSTAPGAIAPPVAAASLADPDSRQAQRLHLHWLAPMPAWRQALLLALVLLVLVGLRDWHRHERASGRFAPLVPLERIDEAWLKENIFSHPPELVGAAWDMKTSASEVAAVLARLTQEKKLASEVQVRGSSFWRRDVLTLKLLVARDSLHGYERRLIDKLFVDDADATDTDLIRAHYKSSGFDPAEVLSDDLKRRLASLLGVRTGVDRWRRQLTLALSITGALLLVVLVVATPESGVALAGLGAPAIVLYLVGRIAAEIWQVQMTRYGGALAVLALAVGGLCAVAGASTVLSLYAWGQVHVIAFLLVVAAMINSLINSAYSRDSAQAIGLRKCFAAARGWFVHELRSPSPRLRDEWYPYLLGFGLGPAVDHWFRRQQMSSDIYTGSAGAGTAAHGGSSSTWTGGGGTFGGGGASASWASAVGGMAAAVAAPSSSSGGGGGGSSGGGGGGGW